MVKNIMKKHIVIFILSLLISNLVAQTNTVVSENYNYSINIPEGFTQVSTLVKNVDMKFSDGKGNGVILNVSPRLPEEKGLSVTNFTKEYFEQGIKPSNPTFKVLSTEKLKIDGENAFIMVFTNSEYGIKSMECYMFRGDIAFVITTSSPINLFDQNQELYRKTILSLKFTK